MLIGNRGAGKTSTVRSLLKYPFQEQVPPTVVASTGEDITLRMFPVQETSWESIRRIGGNFVKHDIPRLNKNWMVDGSMELDSGMIYLIHELKRAVQLHEEKKNEVEGNRGRERNRTDCVPLEEVCLTVWDFGGQKVFHNLHNFYLTKNGICFLVFSLKSFQANSEEELGILKFWLTSASVYARGSVVLLIGTNCDGCEASFLRTVDESLNAMRTAFVREKQIYFEDGDRFCFFPIDNSLGEENEAYLKPLKAAVDNLFKNEVQLASTAKRKISMKWVRFMTGLLETHRQKISRTELLSFAKEEQFNEKSLIDLLSFYTDVGVILMFESMKHSSNPSDHILLRPKLLLQALGCLIYAPERSSALSNYEKTGLLDAKDLHELWKSQGYSSSEIAFLIDLCLKKMLLSKFSLSNDSLDESCLYIVPDMLRKETPCDFFPPEDKCNVILMKVKNFFRSGMFEKTICCFLKKSYELGEVVLEPIVYKNGAVLELQGTILFLRKNDVDQQIELLVKRKGNNSTLVVQTCKEVAKTLFTEFGTSFRVRIILQTMKRKKLLKCSLVALENAIETGDKRVIVFNRMGKKSAVKNFNAFVTCSAEKTSEYDCFFAHAWGEKNESGAYPFHKFVVEIAKNFKEKGLKVWVDENQLSEVGDIDIGILDGAKKSKYSMIFLTKEYIERCANVDSNAAKEFILLVRKGLRTVIPVALDEFCCDPANWIESRVSYHLGTRLFYEFHTNTMRKENSEKILKILRQNGTS